MYRCHFFYQQSPQQFQPAPFVLSAWSVMADQFYSYHTDHEQDTAFYPPAAYALIRTIDGSGLITTTDGPVPLTQNEYLLLPLNRIVEYGSVSKVWQYSWVTFLFPPNTALPAGFTKGHALYNPTEQTLFRELLEAGAAQPGSAAYLNSIFAHYYYYLTTERLMQSPTHKTPQIEEICSYIDQKYYARLRVAGIADFFHISTRRLNQIFHDQYDVSPKRYIQDLKIKKAKELLLQTACQISEIANMLSFDSTYHFSSEFKKSTGLAPSAYRQLHAPETTAEE